MELKYSVTAGLGGKPLHFCIDASSVDHYSLNVGSGAVKFPASCIFVQNYFRERGDKSDLVFVDVGANIGLYTMSVASLGVRTIAVEALAKNYLLLCAAIAKNDFELSVIPIHAAATDTFRLLRVGGDSAWGHVTTEKAGDLVAGLPLTAILSPLKAGAPTLIKIDVEGYERPVLEGMRGLFALGTDIDIVIEVFPNQMASLELLESLGYSAYLVSGDMLIQTSSKTFNPPHVADYFCTQKQIAGRFAGATVRPYDPELVVQLVRAEATCPVMEHRLSIGARLKHAPEQVRQHPEIVEMLTRLRADPNPKVVEAATW